MHLSESLEGLLRRDRVLVLAGLGGVSALAWAYTARAARLMAHGSLAPGSFGLPRMQAWAGVDLLLLFVMWTIMMAAMMVPSATQMVLTFTGISRRQHPHRDPLLVTSAFLLGYVLAWAGFSAVGTLVQWALHSAALINSMGASTSSTFGGALLLAAGLFQWTPWKDACLARCRSPFGFLLTSWQPGAGGALIMGIRHGVYCAGCCWALMALMFVAGMMNLLWLAAIAAFCLLEKVVPAGQLVRHGAGAVLAGWGLYLLGLGLNLA
ncbi:MAG: DUF2182 domain-containing protein [Acidobacteriota bacterium]